MSAPANDGPVAFEIHAGPGDRAPIVLLSAGLGGVGTYWTPQLAALSAHFRVITYDQRGTGRTGGEVPAEGGIAAMADDVIEVIERAGADKVHFVGHALGGLIGLDLAGRHPERIDRLVVVNGWSKVDPHSERCFDVRLALLEHAGLNAFVMAQPLFLYPAEWMSNNAARLAADEAHGIRHFQGNANLRRRIAALRQFDADDRLNGISAPTLALATRDDLLVPWTRSRRLAEGLPNGRFDLFAYGGHAVNITEADRFNSALIAFLRG